jgi:hypothetical protein
MVAAQTEVVLVIIRFHLAVAETIITAMKTVRMVRIVVVVEEATEVVVVLIEIRMRVDFEVGVEVVDSIVVNLIEVVEEEVVVVVVWDIIGTVEADIIETVEEDIIETVEEVEDIIPAVVVVEIIPIKLRPMLIVKLQRTQQSRQRVCRPLIYPLYQ